MEHFNGFVSRQQRVPAIDPPPGVIPNFVNPESRMQGLIVTAICFTVIAGICVCLRMYTRMFLTRSVGWDDYTCLMAMALSITFTTYSIDGQKYGLGVHLWDVPLDIFSPYFLRYLYVLIILQIVFPPFAYLSILLLYLRLFHTKRPMRWSTLAVVAFLVVLTVIMAFMNIFVCTPISKAWDIRIQHGSCLKRQVNGVIGYSLNALTNLLVLGLPVPILRSLKLPTKQKIAVLCIFLTGGFATAASIARLIIYINATYKRRDLTWSVIPTLAWCIVEGNVGIICACALTLRPLVVKFWPRWTESSRARSHSQYLHKGSHVSWNTWRHSKMKRDAPLTQNDVEPNGASYLELGEVEGMRTVVHTSGLDPPKAALSDLDCDGGIIKTVDVAVSSGARDERD